MNTKRMCHSCGKPLTGRVDKRYCNNACKCKDFRRKENELLYSDSPLRMAVCLCSIEQDNQGERPGYGNKLPIANTVVQIIKNESVRASFCLQLHQRFCYFLNDYIGNEGVIPNEKEITGLLTKANNLLEIYNQHPFLPDPTNIVHDRIECLKEIKKTIMIYCSINIPAFSGKRPKENVFSTQNELKATIKQHLEIPCFPANRNDIKTFPGTRRKMVTSIELR